MTIQELRASNDYKQSVEKIKNYKKGFIFTINFSEIPEAKANALTIILRDCWKEGLIESKSIGLSLQGERVEETWQRL